MDPFEPVVVVPQSAVDRGQRLVRSNRLAWACCLLVTICGAFCVGQVVAYRQARSDIAEARQEIERLHQEQVETNAALVAAWENQQSGIKLIVSWGEYIKGRDELISYNKKNTVHEHVAQVHTEVVPESK